MSDNPYVGRPDAPRSGLFNRWADAYHEALFRADITGRRYRVWFEPNNCWWNITERCQRHRERLSGER